MHYFLLGVVALLIAVLLARWFISANPTHLAGVIRTILVVMSFFGAIVFALLGRFPLAAICVGVAIWLARPRRTPRPVQTSSGGPTSTVHTAWFDMALDHATGDLDGVILQDTHTGQRLSDLSFEELEALHRTIGDTDPQSIKVLEAYLDRFYPEWRDHFGGADDMLRPDANMTLDEARDILGVPADATGDDIRRAHRELMKKVHPDRGGSTYLATKINEAKDLLLDALDGHH